MIYLTRFAFPSAGAELHFLSDSRENRRTCYTSRYPFGVFFNREVPTLELEPVTILCGGNGSGKTTILNLMGEKLGLRRGTVFNRSSFFGDYLELCRAETAPAFRGAGENSRVITSDDVFDYLLDLRYMNENIDRRRRELLEEYAGARYAGFQMRSMEDVDATALSYAEVKMLATGDSRIKEKMDLDIQVTKLKMLKSNHLSQQYELQDRVRGYYPNKLNETQLYIDCLEADLPVLEAHPVKEDVFSMTVMGTDYAERKEAGRAIVAACRLIDEPGKEIELGEYRGFPMKLSFSDAKFKVTMKQHLTYTAELSDDQVGNIARINNALERIPQSLEAQRENLARFREEMENAKEEMEKPFTQEQELTQKSARLAELNTALDNEEKGREEPKAEKKTGKGQEKQVEEKSWENGGDRKSVV